MAATDTPATLSEMQTAFLDHIKDATGSSSINTIVTRYLNMANHKIHEESWAWSERRNTIRTFAPYTTGSVDVAITNLTTRRTLTGTDTAWNTTNTFGDTNAQVGMKLTLSSASTVHLISAVGSDTAITLDAMTPYTGTGALDDAGYAIYQDEYALQADFDKLIDMKFFDADRTIRLIGPQEFQLRYPRNSTRSKPKYATIIELGPSGSVALRPRVLFGPAPDAAYIIPYRYDTKNLVVSSAGTAAANLSASTDEPIMPVQFRMGIVWKAVALWHQARKRDSEIAAMAENEYASVMLRARARKSPADDRPRFQPDFAGYWAHTWRQSRTVGRWDADSAWDEYRI